MKLMIFSDTHDRLSKIPSIQKEIIEKNPDMIMHLGDIISPFFINQLFDGIKNKIEKINIILIKGNNDGDLDLLGKVCDRFKIKLYTEYFSEKIDNKNILAIHKPDFVEQLAKSQDYNFIFYGHTHRKLIKKINNTIIANPGTASGYLSDEATYLIVDLDNEKVDFYSF